MGMAASQARFLALTARKSNVEYEGQQINQERTALANESANLYAQLTKMDVPTPPNTHDFYKTQYTFTTSAIDQESKKYTLEELKNTPDGHVAILSYKESNLTTSLVDLGDNSKPKLYSLTDKDKEAMSQSQIDNYSGYQIPLSDAEYTNLYCVPASDFANTYEVLNKTNPELFNNPDGNLFYYIDPTNNKKVFVSPSVLESGQTQIPDTPSTPSTDEPTTPSTPSTDEPTTPSTPEVVIPAEYDVNGDGAVNNNDAADLRNKALEIQKGLAGITGYELNSETDDINGDGNVSIKDATALHRKANTISNFLLDSGMNDANGDGIINETDYQTLLDQATYIQNGLVGNHNDLSDILHDYDNSGNVDISDATYLKKQANSVLAYLESIAESENPDVPTTDIGTTTPAVTASVVSEFPVSDELAPVADTITIASTPLVANDGNDAVSNATSSSKPILDSNAPLSAGYYIGEEAKTKKDEFKVESFTQNDIGRTTSLTIQIGEKDGQPLTQTFELEATSVMDEAAYDQAMLDYEYEQAKYNKAMSDLNAKTEAIQKKDKALELELKQLDTEQNAISTEMDAVTKVVEDNVEKTFKTFA